MASQNLCPLRDLQTQGLGDFPPNLCLPVQNSRSPLFKDCTPDPRDAWQPLLIDCSLHFFYLLSFRLHHPLSLLPYWATLAGAQDSTGLVFHFLCRHWPNPSNCPSLASLFHFPLSSQRPVSWLSVLTFLAKWNSSKLSSTLPGMGDP